MAIEMSTTFTTDTGVEFHLEENATNHASKLGLKGVRVWRTHMRKATLCISQDLMQRKTGYLLPLGKCTHLAKGVKS